jgi:hypothetical protein
VRTRGSLPIAVGLLAGRGSREHVHREIGENVSISILVRQRIRGRQGQASRAIIGIAGDHPRNLAARRQELIEVRKNKIQDRKSVV